MPCFLGLLEIAFSSTFPLVLVLLLLLPLFRGPFYKGCSANSFSTKLAAVFLYSYCQSEIFCYSFSSSASSRADTTAADRQQEEKEKFSHKLSITRFFASPLAEETSLGLIPKSRMIPHPKFPRFAATFATFIPRDGIPVPGSLFRIPRNTLNGTGQETLHFLRHHHTQPTETRKRKMVVEKRENTPLAGTATRTNRIGYAPRRIPTIRGC